MLTINEIRKALADSGANWIAGETPIFAAGARAGDPSSLLFGLRLDDDAGRLRAAGVSPLDNLALPPPPPAADWRASGHVGAVRDQGHCRVCVAFATCAAIEASRKIATGDDLELSPGHLFHCNAGSCADGWGLAHGLEAARAGVGLESDLPWDPAGSCVPIAEAARVTGYAAHWDAADRRRAVAAGPVVAGMCVHEDLLAYRSGIYSHVAGAFLDNHAVCVVGYDDAEGAWLVKNSWGPGFGDGGFFHIAYGECDIDARHPFYSLRTSA